MNTSLTTTRCRLIALARHPDGVIPRGDKAAEPGDFLEVPDFGLQVGHRSTVAFSTPYISFRRGPRAAIRRPSRVLSGFHLLPLDGGRYGLGQELASDG